MRPDEQITRAGVLRVGVVLDSYLVPAWKAWVIDDLLGADFVELLPIFVPSIHAGDPKGAAGPWLFQQYAAWDDLRAQCPDDPLLEVDLSGRLNHSEGKLNAKEIHSGAFARLNLDVVMWLATSEPDHSLQPFPRFGLWFYRAQKAEYFWEIYNTNPVTRSHVEVFNDEEANPLVAYEGYSATEQGWSWRKNRVGPTARASTFPLRCLRQLHEEHAEDLRELNLNSESNVRVGEWPSNVQMIGFFLRNAFRTVSRRLLYSHQESSWFVAYRSDKRQFVANSETLDLAGFKVIHAPPDHFYADPFVIEWRGKDYLFVEDYLFAESRGCISVMEIDANGIASEAHRVLDRPYHLSYPFVFENDGDLYMIPETLGAQSIELYRATEAPTRWEFVKTLRANVAAVDTTVWKEHGLFYFFTNIAERGASVNDELSLFIAESLLGPWEPHPKNPLVTDVRRSRGAGKLFRRGGRLIRPSQDCSIRYGYACQLNEVEVLTPTCYREKPLERIEPIWAPGLIGTHTLNSNARIEVIDGQVYRRRYRRKG